MQRFWMRQSLIQHRGGSSTNSLDDFNGLRNRRFEYLHFFFFFPNPFHATTSIIVSSANTTATTLGSQPYHTHLLGRIRISVRLRVHVLAHVLSSIQSPPLVFNGQLRAISTEKH
jgi:hypothetical protein